MGSVTRVPRGVVHPLFHGVFEDWLGRADAMSALPDAPVVPDDPGRRRLPALWGRVGQQRSARSRPAAARKATAARGITACATPASSADSPAC